MRPVLDILAESPYFSRPDGEHPPNISSETGLSDPDDICELAYLEAADSFAIYVVGPAFLTSSDIKSGEAQFSGGGTHTGGAGGWLVVPEFTEEGGEKLREATAALAGFPVGSMQRQLAIVVDGVVLSAPAVASDVDPNEGLDPNQIVITIGLSDNPQQEAERLAAILTTGDA